MKLWAKVQARIEMKGAKLLKDYELNSARLEVDSEQVEIGFWLTYVIVLKL